VIDPANVCMVCGKSEEAKRILARFIAFDAERKEIPKWDFIAKEKEASTGRYSMEYLMKFMDLLDSTGDAATISVIKNHPVQIENIHFICILAPRIEQGDEK
jgi:hypothetical protein